MIGAEGGEAAVFAADVTRSDDCRAMVGEAVRRWGGLDLLHNKGAVIALTRAMAIDHAAQGVRVNCIAPGPVYTPMVYAGGMSAELRERRRRASPLGREGTGWDVGY